MNDLCFETIQFSPFTGCEDPRLLEQIAAAADTGFASIGLDLASVDDYRRRGGSLTSLRDALEAHALPCFELQDLAISGDLDATLRRAEALAEVGSVLRPRWIQAAITSARHDEAAMLALGRAAEVVDSVGAALAIEYLPFLPIDSIASTRAFLDAAGVPSARIVVDSWHFVHGPDGWDSLADLPLDALAYPQFNDHPRIVAASEDRLQATMHGRCMPGEGCFELERFATAFRAKGYDGPVSVEVLSRAWRARERSEFAARLAEASRPFWT